MNKKVVIIGFLALGIILGGVAFYLLSPPPKETLSQEFKEEAVTKLLGRKAQLEADNAPTGNTTYEGKYITFGYPAKAVAYDYRERSHSSGSADLEDFSFDLRSPKLVFNMSVRNATTGLLSDIPAVNLRELRSSDYEKKAIVQDSANGTVYFKKGQEPEKSGFFLHKKKLFTISVTGTSEEAVSNLFDDVLKTVSFSDSK